LSKTLARPILITEPVARLLSAPLEPLGEHVLRGLARPMGLFSPRREDPQG
jgi:adenylate cyclase